MSSSSEPENNPNQAPPEYDGDGSGEGAGVQFPLPAYHVAAELPTYEEAERSKGKYPDSMVDGDDPESGPFPDLTLITLETDETEDTARDIADQSLLGNDFVFFTAFLTAFLFNWIGFLLLMCFCHTIAARYGALSGFGLSLTKWTLIVKRSAELSAMMNSSMNNANANHVNINSNDEISIDGGPDGHRTKGETTLLWWLIMAFGLLICIRSVVQYLHIKRRWGSLSTAARERLFFFY